MYEAFIIWMDHVVDVDTFWCAAILSYELFAVGQVQES